MTMRCAAARCALGAAAPDLIVANGTLFNSATGEFLPGMDIWVAAGLIARVTKERVWAESKVPIVDAEGMVVLPGLIDTHTHVYGMVGVDEFVRRVLPTGVTSVVAETDELPHITGLAGYEMCRSQFSQQPLRIFYTVSPLPGLTEVEELLSPTAGEITELLAHPRCVGIGELYWNNLLLEGPQGDRVRALAEAALAAGKMVEGHTAGARENRLQAYVALGPSSCHESITLEQARDRLRLGLWTMVRQGGTRKELGELAPIFSESCDLRRLVLVTDGQNPRGFLKEGYLDGAVRTALAEGAPPRTVYQAVTVNPAAHFGLERMLGMIGPGFYADLVIIPSPEEYVPRLVFIEGRPVFAEGRALVEPEPVSYPPEVLATVRVSERWQEGAERIWDRPAEKPARALEIISKLVTAETVVEGRAWDKRSGDASSESGPVGFGPDVAALVAVDRLKARGSFWGLVKGFGLSRGAVGSTMCWDTGDLLAIGCDVESLRTVVERLQAGGGVVHAVGREVVAEVWAPVCGYVSLDSLENVALRMEAVEESLAAAGVPWENPILTLSTLGTAAIPHLRVTHRGYVRLRDRALLGVDV